MLKGMKTRHLTSPRPRLKLLACVLLLAWGCADEPSPAEPQDRVSWMMDNSAPYLNNSPAQRRQWLERGWWMPELGYSQELLQAYGLEDEGWELLPELNFEVESSLDGPFQGEPLFDGRSVPQSREQWLALGESVFWKMPMRRDAYVEWLAGRPELWASYGVEADARGGARGLVRYRDTRGAVRTGMSCGFCHSVDGVAGRANKRMDLGGARAAFRRARGLDPGEFADWGAGRVDVTDDEINDAMAIPNLWGVSAQSYFNASGAVRLDTPAVAAVRFETQYVLNHSFEARPPRVLIWALAMYVYSLEAPKVDEAQREAVDDAVFMARCASCHDPDRGYSGELILAELLNSDEQAARSPTRGTGSYRVPSLLGISQGGPYLHDLSVPDLETLLERGHPYGEPLSEQERAILLNFLKTL